MESETGLTWPSPSLATIERSRRIPGLMKGELLTGTVVRYLILVPQIKLAQLCRIFLDLTINFEY